MTEGTVETAGSGFRGRPRRGFKEVPVGEGLPLGVVPQVLRYPVMTSTADGGVCRIGIGVRVLNEIEAFTVPRIVRQAFRVKVTGGSRHASLPVREYRPREIRAVALPA